MVIYYVIFVII